MKEVYLEFYNHSFVLQGLISQFSSLTWVQRFQDVGTFELICPYTEDIKSWLAVDLFVMRSDAEQVYYVDSVEYSRDITGNKQVKITGSDVVGILKRRVLKNNMSTADGVTSTLQSAVAQLLYLTAYRGSSTQLETRRALDSWFSFDWSELPSRNLEYNLYGVNLLEQLYEYAKTYGFGITAERTPNASAPMTIYLKAYVDKSDTVIFSEGMKNLSAWSYEHNNSDRVNVAYVVKTEWSTVNFNDSTFSGLDRFEVFADSGISNQRDDGTTIPDADYTRMLQAYAATLMQYRGTKELHAESQETVFKYPDDYKLGDIIYIGTDVSAGRVYINEITEIFDATGYSVFPTLETVS